MLLLCCSVHGCERESERENRARSPPHGALGANGTRAALISQAAFVQGNWEEACNNDHVARHHTLPQVPAQCLRRPASGLPVPVRPASPPLPFAAHPTPRLRIQYCKILYAWTGPLPLSTQPFQPTSVAPSSSAREAGGGGSIMPRCSRARARCLLL